MHLTDKGSEHYPVSKKLFLVAIGAAIVSIPALTTVAAVSRSQSASQARMSTQPFLFGSQYVDPGSSPRSGQNPTMIGGPSVCQTDADCQGGETCVAQTASYCKAPAPSEPISCQDSCKRDADCSAGESPGSCKPTYDPYCQKDVYTCEYPLPTSSPNCPDECHMGTTTCPSGYVCTNRFDSTCGGRHWVCDVNTGSPYTSPTMAPGIGSGGKASCQNQCDTTHSCPNNQECQVNTYYKPCDRYMNFCATVLQVTGQPLF